MEPPLVRWRGPRDFSGVGNVTFFIRVAVIWVFTMLSTCFFVLCLFSVWMYTLKKIFKAPTKQQHNKNTTLVLWAHLNSPQHSSADNPDGPNHSQAWGSLRGRGCDLQESMGCVFSRQSSVNNTPSSKAGEQSWRHVLWWEPEEYWLTRSWCTHFRNWIPPGRAGILFRWPGSSLSLLLIGIHVTSPPQWARGESLGGTYIGHCRSWSYQLPQGNMYAPSCI